MQGQKATYNERFSFDNPLKATSRTTRYRNKRARATNACSGEPEDEVELEQDLIEGASYTLHVCMYTL